MASQALLPLWVWKEYPDLFCARHEKTWKELILLYLKASFSFQSESTNARVGLPSYNLLGFANCLESSFGTRICTKMAENIRGRFEEGIPGFTFLTLFAKDRIRKMALCTFDDIPNTILADIFAHFDFISNWYYRRLVRAVKQLSTLSPAQFCTFNVLIVLLIAY